MSRMGVLPLHSTSQSSLMAITIITERQLAADQQGLWKKALQAVQTKNYS